MSDRPEIIVWTKDMCPYCVAAKDLLKQKGLYWYEERKIDGERWTREQLLEAVPNARTVPQIFIDGKLIGTFENLKEYFNTRTPHSDV